MKKMKPQKIKITFVCTGNTCRSAMAESVLRHELKKRKLSDKFTISSAGLYVKEGEDMNPTAKIALKNNKISPHRHRAKVLTETAVKRATVLVCMTSEHKERVNSDKAFTVAEITGGNDVYDPFGLGVEAYERTLKYLIYACDDIINFAQKLADKKREQEVVKSATEEDIIT